MPFLFSHFIRPPYLHLSQVLFDPLVLEPPTHCETSFHIAYRQAVIAITIWREFRPGKQQLGGTATSMACTEVPRQLLVERRFLDNRCEWPIKAALRSAR